jgi:predicted DNA-binding protein
MGRPAKIDEPTKTYSLLMSVSQYDRLAAHSERLQKTSREQVAVSDLMREGIDIYLDALDEDSDEEQPEN